MSWKVFRVRPGEVHVYPMYDVMVHDLRGLECPCGPKLDFFVRSPDKSVVHNSLDGRELSE